MNSFFYNFSVNFFKLYKKIKPYFGLAIFWSFYIRGFLLLPYGNIFDAGLFFTIFSICLFLSFINYVLFFNLTLKIIGKILSFQWSRKWLGLYHCLAAHLAFFPNFFLFLFIAIGLYQGGILDLDFADDAASSKVAIQAAREIGRPAFIAFFPLQLSHFLFKAFDPQAIGADDKAPYNVIFKKPGAKNVDIAMLNFIKKLEQQGKLDIYDNRSVVLDSLEYPDKENWMVCLYNEVLNSNETLIKKDKWYAPVKINLPSFCNNLSTQNKTVKVDPSMVPNSYVFYLSHGVIKNAVPDFNIASKKLTEHSKAIFVVTGVLGTAGAAWAAQRDYRLRCEEAELKQKELQLQQKIQKDNAMLDILNRKKMMSDQIFNEQTQALAKRHECQNNLFSRSSVCEKTYSEVVSIIENKKKDDLKELNRVVEKVCPAYNNRYPLILENNENNFSLFKKLMAIFF